jgi:hypothetical protein
MLMYQIFTLLVLGIIAWEDLRERSIHWWWLPLLAGCMLIPAVHVWKNGDLLQRAFNLAFLSLQGSAILLWLMIRHRGWTDPFKYIGLGDLLFFVVLAIGLSPANFILFYITGLALCLPAYFLMRSFLPKSEPTVPTAGFMALYLMVWNLADLMGPAAGLYSGSLAENLLGHG